MQRCLVFLCDWSWWSHLTLQILSLHAIGYLFLSDCALKFSVRLYTDFFFFFFNNCICRYCMISNSNLISMQMSIHSSQNSFNSTNSPLAFAFCFIAHTDSSICRCQVTILINRSVSAWLWCGARRRSLSSPQPLVSFSLPLSRRCRACCVYR